MLDGKNLEPSNIVLKFILSFSGLDIEKKLPGRRFGWSLLGSRISAIELGLEIMRGFLPGIRLEVISKSP